MPEQQILSFVEARRNLSGLMDEVSRSRKAIIITKRNKPMAAILGADYYEEMKNARKRLGRAGAKKVLKLSGIAEPLGDLDQAISELRRSRIMAVVGSMKK